jgi:hypothetical protein
MTTPAVSVTHGFELEGASIEQACALVEGFTQTVRQLHRKRDYERLAESVVTHIDSATITGAAATRPLERARQQLRDSVARRERSVDDSFRAALFALDGNVYIIIDSGSGWNFSDPSAIEAWKQMPGLIDVSYKAQAKPFEGVSAHEWTRRRKVWSGPLVDFAIAPWSTDIVIDCTRLDRCWDAQGVLDHLPPHQARANWLAAELLQDEMLKADPRLQSDVRLLMSRMQQPDFKAAYDARSEVIKRQLIPELTMEHLLAGVVARRAA